MAYLFFRSPMAVRILCIGAVLWIWLVLITVVAIPVFPFYALLEQVTGIALDIGLPIVYTVLLFQAYAEVKKVEGKEKEKEDAQNAVTMWWLAWTAHTVHLFGTILPLVVENFVIGQDEAFSSFLEGLIGFTVPVTMVLYTHWCTIYQDNVLSYKRENDGTWNMDTEEYLVVQNPRCIKECCSMDQSERCCYGQFPLFLFWFIVAVFLGLIPTTITPAIMGVCPDDGDFNTTNSSYSATGVS